MLPTGQNERRQDCVDHEKRIDDIAAEIHKHGGWFKVIGGSLSFAFIVLGWFGSGIDAKLTSIQAMLTDGKVTLMQHQEQIKSMQQDIREIQERHKYLDQNKKGR